MTIPPSHWTRCEPAQMDGLKIASVWEHKLVRIRVFRSVATLDDGSKWIHLSVSRPNQMPSWSDLMKAKNEFLGENTEAYQVLPKRSEHINLHSTCLHLWARVDGKRCVANLHQIVLEEAL